MPTSRPPSASPCPLPMSRESAALPAAPTPAAREGVVLTALLTGGPVSVLRRLKASAAELDRAVGMEGCPEAPAAADERSVRRWLATVGGAGQLSPPSLDGNALVFGVARPRGSRIVQRTLGTRQHRTLARSDRLLISTC